MEGLVKINISILILVILLGTSSKNIICQENKVNKTILADSTYLNELSNLKLSIIEKDIEIAKSERKLGWVIAVPTAAFAILSTTTAILYPPASDDPDWFPIIGVTVASAVLVYIGIDMIITANREITKLEKDKNIQFGLSFQPNTKSFLLNLQIDL